MKKKLLPITLGLALMALAGTAYAQSATTTTSTDTSTEHKAQGFKGGDKVKLGGIANQELLTLLNIDEATLHTELKAGKSLAAIGEAKGISKQQIIDLLVKQDAERLAKAVTDGKITQAQADERKAKQLEMITKRVDQAGEFGGKGGPGERGGKGPEGRDGHGPGGFGGPGGGLEAASSIIGLTTKEIGDQLKAGKSLSEIALEKGVSKQQLIDGLVKKETERITKQVDEKRQPKASSAAPAAATTE
ncbi:hypothetical protein OB236_39545 [Paenibacillus sp. WQ 127069]|uniref:LysM domain-containing protein n=1 Tax=Paenibacillus baimaensis TaxID=2982185 RepID=A0ABT2UUD6_9BACL|nr:hypothetical protein [Paenibacillus sp. WQ 127069]MCU6798240.1 hypothetical protein [Paenibacillus sp. WQ 127069]